MTLLKEHLKSIQTDLNSLNKFIYENPELGNEEVKACRALVELMEKHDFRVDENFVGLATAFRATYTSKKAGPKICFMAEYDALPEIGHGCGHNLIAATSVGAGIVLAKMIDELGGQVVVLGTPAEENDGAKVNMVDQGVFNDIDMVLIGHPSNQTSVAIECLAMDAIEFEFTGKAAHAAASPELGINALDGVISTFNNINALREHILPSARVHGIISEGGLAANIVPERAVAQFYVRATKKSYLKEVVEKVKNCARAGALSSGATLKISNYEKSYDNMVRNKALISLVEEKFIQAGIKDIDHARASLGSADAGNVSHVCPTVHPMFAITTKDIAGHTRAFADATQTPLAQDMMLKVIEAFVETAIVVIENPEILKRIKMDFDEAEK